MSHPHIKIQLQQFCQSNKIPHIIFHGQSGSGKRTIVYEFIKNIYDNNTEKIQKYVKYINCSEGKGIKFIRDELKFFAKQNIYNQKGLVFKSIILLNADNLTQDAQGALRRCIEIFSHNTRFFIIIQDPSKLLKPILSRFSLLHIPQPVLNNVVCNLHKNNIDTIWKSNNQRQKWLYNYLEYKKSITSINTCLNATTVIYNKGYNIYDIMEHIKKIKLCDKKREYTLSFVHTIKNDFRNEELIMFHTLYFLYVRNDFNLENISLV